MARDLASLILTGAKCFLFAVAIFYVLLAASAVVGLVWRRRIAKVDRDRWSRIDSMAKQFRGELEKADWQDELSHYRRAA